MFECFFLTRTGLCHEKNKDNVSVTQIRILFTDLMSLACGWSSRAASASRAATTKGTSERAELACSRRCGTRAKQSTLLWKTVQRNDLLADVSASCRTGEDCASRKCNRRFARYTSTHCTSAEIRLASWASRRRDQSQRPPDNIQHM